jgi:hypothetical protein
MKGEVSSKARTLPRERRLDRAIPRILLMVGWMAKRNQSELE